MKKSIIAMLLLLCTSAFAEDMTVFRHLEPRQSRTILFEVPKGTSLINVSSDTSGAIFDCEVKKEDGQSYKKTKTNTCDFVIDFDIPHKLALHLTNDTIKPIDCAAHFLTLSKKK